jgi:hypothetical protein
VSRPSAVRIWILLAALAWVFVAAVGFGLYVLLGVAA